jgi:large-conductance mechanosensitive channel
MSAVPPSPPVPPSSQPVSPYPPFAGPPFAGPPPFAPPQYYGRPPLSALALVAFIGSLFVGLVGVICGHIALSQLKKTGERGYGFALAGVIIGYVSTAFAFLLIALVVVSVIFSVAAAKESVVRTAPRSAPISQADITAVTNASSALSASMASIESTMVDSPGPAREALNTAEEAFKSSVSTVSDETLQGDLHYVTEDLTYLSSDLADYAYGGSGSPTANQLKSDVSTLKDDMATLDADCH